MLFSLPKSRSDVSESDTSMIRSARSVRSELSARSDRSSSPTKKRSVHVRAAARLLFYFVYLFVKTQICHESYAWLYGCNT